MFAKHLPQVKMEIWNSIVKHIKMVIYDNATLFQHA